MFEQEKSYSLRFLESNPEIDYGQEWNWKPKAAMNQLDIKTATFSGKTNLMTILTNNV